MFFFPEIAHQTGTSACLYSPSIPINHWMFCIEMRFYHSWMNKSKQMYFSFFFFQKSFSPFLSSFLNVFFYFFSAILFTFSLNRIVYAWQRSLNDSIYKIFDVFNIDEVNAEWRSSIYRREFVTRKNVI